MLLLPSGNKGFNSAFKGATLKEDATLAFEALNSYISPKPDYFPLIATTGVLLLKANYITQLYLHYHSFYLKG